MRQDAGPIETERSSERGATAVEYGLLVSLIAAVVAVIVTTLGGQVANLFNSIAGQF
jgi:pilus assembly protein Flp/PilA